MVIAEVPIEKIPSVFDKIEPWLSLLYLKYDGTDPCQLYTELVTGDSKLWFVNGYEGFVITMEMSPDTLYVISAIALRLKTKEPIRDIISKVNKLFKQYGYRKIQYYTVRPSWMKILKDYQPIRIDENVYEIEL